jgi:5-oxoprolinase (ATP-hydrolysing)
MSSRSGWRFAVDRGGTFTDVVGESPAGELYCLKLLSESPDRYADATCEGIERLLAAHGAPGARIDRVRVGTTVATNALLERTGAATVLIITAGFGDALSIGSQERPHLFRRHIELPSPLHARVIEAHERVSAAGEVLEPLDAAKLGAELAAARASGCTAAAIVFMHGWRHPAHERAAADLATAAGFAQVSVSHAVAPLERLVPRGASTVADAYLKPVVAAYVRELGSALNRIAPGAQLEFMQSHGGLASAAHFRGPGALLSGPAGGLVGMVGAGRALGLEALVGFDMGGTSTDVAVYDGAYRRRYESEIAGFKLAWPMLDIHTVAAGGGSVLSFESGRYRVGPRSAGARPGPACYGLGGPLAVTDIHVLLGRLRPECFPRVFGADGASSLDVAPSRAGFATLAAAIGAESGAAITPEAVAEGFLTVAVETMATAIKAATLGAGHDPGRYTLVAFGGAGGQHACRVAEALGMRQVLIHPLAGVLSALGVGRAAPLALKRATLGVALDADGVRLAGHLATRLAQEALALVDSPELASVSITADVRLDAAEATLPVPVATVEAMQAGFVTQHRARYGYAPAAGARLLIEALTVEASTPTEAMPSGATAQRGPRASSVRAYFAGAWREVPLQERAALTPGQTLAGPAILTESTATTIIEAGWRATVAAGGELLLAREEELRLRAVAPARVDGVLLEVFHALFRHAAEQMGAVLRQAASSVNIRERLDYSCALFAADGALIANAPHMPVHLGSMGASVRAVQAKHGAAIARGDSFLLNSPYAGGTHLPDLTVVTPVFLSAATPAFWVASRAHHADVGGASPGSMPPFSTDIGEEGVLFEGERIVHDGRLDEDWLRERLAAGPFPARAIERNLADLAAQLAANARGVEELTRLCSQYGAAVVRAYMQHVQDNAEAMVRAAVTALARNMPAGEFTARASEELDGGELIVVSIRLDADSGGASVDFAGSSPVSPGNFNAPLAVCTAAVLYVFRTLVDADIPLNEGCLRPIRLLVPQPSLLAPAPPAAVVAGNVETSQCIVDALYGALGVLAGSQGTMNNLSFGNARCQYYETIAGGAGAGPGFPGASGVHTHMTNSRLTDPEVLESRLPVRLRQFCYRPGSGGRGRWRGGDGLVRELEFLEPLEVSIRSTHRRRGPRGAAGGEPGAPGRNLLCRADGSRLDLGATAYVRVQVGDVLRIETPGGGGFGTPEAGAD